MKRTTRFLSVLLALIMVLGMLPATVFAAESGMAFTDVKKADWFYDEVQYVYENGLMNGTGEGLFDPAAQTSRGMVVTILWRMEGAPVVDGAQFDDVADGKFYTEAVKWAAANKIVNGYSAVAFGPNDAITREQLAAILYRYAQYKGYDVSVGEETNILSYSDAASISDYAVAAMQWACGAGLIGGTDKGELLPFGTASRAETAAVLMRLCEGVVKSNVTVTFDLNYVGAEAAQKVSVAAGETVVKPEKAPTRKGYTFSGWYVKASGGKKFDFSTPITESITVYAHWNMIGGGGGASTVSLTNVHIVRDDADATGVALNSGDQLSASVSPDRATYSLSWLVGGVEKSTANVYTVSPMDVGKSVVVKATGTGSYSGTVTSAATGVVASASIDLENDDADTTPVVVADNATFKDKDGAEITIDENATLALEVSSENVAAEEQDAVEEAIETGMVDAIGISASDAQDVPVNYVAVDADLIMTTTTTTENEETGESEVTTEETEIHPVGETTLTLSKENLGIAADVDISDYTFLANHTNKNGENEIVTGTVVTIDGVQYVRFVLNGLSRIYIGNVPPLTVTFDTDGGSEIPAQKVKLGGYATDVEPPVKAGWIFAGWDHDIQTENIIKDITVTARWIQGTTAADSQLSGVWKKNGEVVEAPANVTVTTANGTVTLLLDAEASYDAGLSYTLSVAPMEGAVKMATATTADGAVAATEYVDAVAFEIPADVTDAEGTVRTSNTNRYIKWIGEDDMLLGLQSARLVVRTNNSVAGNYDTQTRVETKSVDRGLGQIEFYLTNGTDSTGAAIADYVGAINGYLSSNGSGSTTEYRLDLYANFYDWFYDSELREYHSGANYAGIKIVITPFEGESFSVAPTVDDAYYWSENSEESVDFTSSVSTALVDGKAVVTFAKPAMDEEYIDMYVTLSMGGVTQELNIYVDCYDTSVEYTELSSDNWSEVVAALANGTDRVYYTGTEDVTLTSALTLESGQQLYFNNRTGAASLTIGNGGTLTLKADDLDGSGVYIQYGSLTVANGGKLTTNSQSIDQNRYYSASVRALNGITVANGGTLDVPEYGWFRIYNRQGGFKLENGGTIVNAGDIYVDRDSDSTVANTVSGTITTGTNGNMTMDLEFNDGLTITSTGSVSVNGRGRFYVYGGLKVEEGGSVTSSSSRLITLSGRTENNGTITINSGNLNIWNTGYSVANTGTISVASGARLSVAGTVLVNTGTITGDGSIYTSEQNDASSYDNGIEYVDVEEYTPDNYSRYQFVKDPSATVDVIYFIGEVSNQDGGTCTLGD